MKNYDGKLVGIMGTVIIHLIAAILFMSFQIRSLKKDMSDRFEVEIVRIDDNVKKEENPIDLPVSGVEKILRGDDQMLDIARNLANKADVRINAADYIDQVKEELIKSGKLGKDNYIDEQKRLGESVNDPVPSPDKNDLKENKEKESSREMAANYKGPTRIYYNLKGRNHLYLPIPIYKCEGSGKVVLSIEVDQKGSVAKAAILSAESTTSDPCLVETALQTALVSRFNPDANAPAIETGTLTYHFVAQ